MTQQEILLLWYINLDVLGLAVILSKMGSKNTNQAETEFMTASRCFRLSALGKMCQRLMHFSIMCLTVSVPCSLSDACEQTMEQCSSAPASSLQNFYPTLLVAVVPHELLVAKVSQVPPDYK